MPTARYIRTPSPIGPLLIAAEGEAVVALRFPMHRGEPAQPDADWTLADGDSLLREATAQMNAYFARERTDFDLPLHPAGTEFQQRVWAQLCRIPFGETISYGELARRVGNANASRAVGLANGRNPIAIVIPCHRVIGANGSLTGFGGGVDVKRVLLELEGWSGAASEPVLFAQAAGT